MTNGIVAIKKNGVVIVKVVVGCEGHNAPKVAEAIKRFHNGGGVLSCSNVAGIALEQDMGCLDCLVVIAGSGLSGNRIWYNGRFSHPNYDEWTDNNFERYLATFQQPEFNPRWESGICGIVEVVEFWEPCLVCDKPVEGYKPQYCCSGHMCGCRGLPVEPAICSEQCWDALMHKPDTTLEQRMKEAGIKKCQSKKSKE